MYHAGRIRGKLRFATKATGIRRVENPDSYPEVEPIDASIYSRLGMETLSTKTGLSIVAVTGWCFYIV